MVDVLHGNASRTANSGKGIHGIVGYANVSDEAARAGLSNVAGDEERVAKQTGGNKPGLYLADGAGGFKYMELSAENKEPTWADEFWVPGDQAYDGSDELTSWPSDAGTTTLSPGATPPTVSPRISTSGTLFNVNTPNRWGAQSRSVNTTESPGRSASGSLGSSIGAGEDLYLAYYGLAFANDTDLNTLISVDGGLGIYVEARLSGAGILVPIIGFAAVISGSGDQALGGSLGLDYNRKPALFEAIHRVGTSLEIWWDGRLLHRNTTNVGARNASTTSLGLSIDSMSNALVSDGGLALFSGIVISTTIPTLEQRMQTDAFYRAL